MDLDTNQLREMVRRDDLAAMVQLISLYYERLYAFLRRLAGNDADAADVRARAAIAPFVRRPLLGLFVDAQQRPPHLR